MDPLSVTASTAGLISLGITVSGGLVRYCKAYQGQDANLTQLSRHAQDLESFLRLIEDRTAGLQSPGRDLDNSLRGCRDACDACLGDFKRLNAKYSSPRLGQNFKERSRRLARDLRYPFDKAKFDDFRSQLQEFYTRLSGHLQLVHLDITRDIRSEISLAMGSVGRQVQSSISNTEQVITSMVHNNTDRLEATFLHGFKEADNSMKTSLDRNLSAISTQVALLSEGQASQALTIKDHINQALELQQNKILDLFTQAQATRSQTENRVALPELSIVHVGSDQRVRLETSPDVPVQNIFDSLCTCLRTSQGRWNMRHQKGCIYSSKNLVKRDFAVNFRIFRHRVTAKWQLEYHPMAWTRGWRIYPGLRVKATVPNYSPAFRAIEMIRRTRLDGSGKWRRFDDRDEFDEIDAVREMDKIDSFSKGEEVSTRMRRCLVKLQWIFANGLGWPTDVDDTGENLLHRALSKISELNLPVTSSDETITAVVDFIDALVKMGVPVNEERCDICHTRTPLTDALWFLGVSGRFNPRLLRLVVDKLLERDAVIAPKEKNGRILSAILILRRPEFYEPFECNALCFAVLNHCEFGVVRLLRRDRSLLLEPICWRFTPLHLAVNWPRGLSVLIEHGGSEVQSLINVTDSADRPVLYYAIEMGEIESVEILLKSEAHVADTTLKALDSIRDTARARKIMGILARTLAQRHRRLSELALRTLPTRDVDKLGLQEDVLLDDKALQVVQALKQRGISVPAVYDTIEPGSVYHRDYLTSAWAQALFDAGFVEVDSRLYGRTPLMGIFHKLETTTLDDMLGLTHWFHNHGADLYALLRITPGKPHGIHCGSDCRLEDDGPSLLYPAVHYCTESLGWIVGFEGMYRGAFHLSSENMLLLPELLNDKATDPCRCYCAANGCTPASKFVCGIYSQLELYGGDTEDLVDCMTFIESAIIGKTEYNVVSDVIRSITFECLGMRHTCCRYTTRFERTTYLENEIGSRGISIRREGERFCRYEAPDLIELDEAEAVREEYHHLGRLLDTLVEEFERRFRELGVPLSQFVKRYLWPRVYEVMRERDEVSSEDLHAIRKIGVVLDES
ncbi:hypothetical protein F4779DRAFT_594791 [Xylariaceae sp. FL0662B]|nr:hypothetical protein F4779DRAFT_594791 [Xylariaceae sp. FL0662B]